MRRVSFTIAAIACAMFFAGCNKSPAPAPATQTAGSAQTNSASAGKREVYKARGVVKEIVSPTRARIAHEAIPNYMPAMTMALDAKNTNELAGLKAGDQITFDLVATDDDGWIENVKTVGKEPIVTGDTNKGVTFTKTRVVDPLTVGDVVPNYPFVNEEGKAIKLSDFKGQALGITFIFTRCPFPTYCPRMTSNFEKAAAELAKQGNPTNWHLLSISFDPEYDTPEKLKEHANRFKRDAAKWNFVTSEKIEILALTEQLGLMFATRNGTIEHNLRTAIIGPDGKLRQIYVGNEWDVNEFTEEMKKAARGEPISDPK
jgi:protein SCO1